MLLEICIHYSRGIQGIKKMMITNNAACT